MNQGSPAPTRRIRRRPSHRRRRLLLRAGAVVGGTAVLLAAAALIIPRLLPSASEAGPVISTPRPTPRSTPTPTPLSPAETLLATTDDPLACVITFELPAAPASPASEAPAPQLQTAGALFAGLPIPTHQGAVFAGWYDSAAEAAAFEASGRINGAQLATCENRQRTLHGAWMTPEQSTAVGTEVPILMYHQFTTKPEGEEGWLRRNYAYIGDFTAQMAYIAEEGFYLPTWDELNAFIDGALHLPPRSVIITDDDADSTWLDLAVPVVTANRLLTTSFVITRHRHEGSPSPYVLQRSHTDDMHEAGDNGQGRMVNWSAAQIAADLERSAEILGAREVVAYPYGHYDDTTKEGVREAGFLLGRTIDWGYVSPGTDKLALPVIRMNYGDTLDALRDAIG